MYNILGGISTAFGYLRTIWTEALTFIKETDYLFVILVSTLIIMGFRILMAARGAAGDNTARSKEV